MNWSTLEKVALALRRWGPAEFTTSIGSHHGFLPESTGEKPFRVRHACRNFIIGL